MKKQLIMEKALELFAKNGFEATSVQQITESCGISKGAFYLSFKSKDELMLSIIEHFMDTITSEVEQAVSENNPDDELLYNYFLVFFRACERHADFAKLFIQELPFVFNRELIERMLVYHSYLTKLAFSMVERQFPKTDRKLHAELVFIIQGFVKNYGELFFVNHHPVNVHELCIALVEKTKILAEHDTHPVLSAEFFTLSLQKNIVPTKEQLNDMLAEKGEEADEPIVKESLELLRKHLNGKPLSPAVLHGLLKNISSHRETKWTASLYQKYLTYANEKE